jgi:nucleotide-binding universal stress UspA family protein
MFTHILCATDVSEDGDRALDYAHRIAIADGAELHIVHVVEKLAAGRAAGQNVRVDEQECYDTLRHQSAEMFESGIKTTLHRPSANAGDVADCVSRIASDNDVDLIIVGTRGRSALVGAVLGSVTQRLLHVSPCPVLAVPHARATLEKAEPETLTATSCGA